MRLKKFLVLSVMLLMAVVAMAQPNVKAYTPPGDDVGSVLTQLVCTPSTDGMAYGIVNVNIEDRHPLVTLQEVSTQDAQVVKADNVVKCDAMMSEAPVVLRCPMMSPNSQMFINYTDPLREGCHNLPFKPSRTGV